jgi:hypothetical protein
LGAEKTPTLCYSIFAYSQFIEKWNELVRRRPGFREFIRPGLEKLEDYSLHLDEVPAYTIAMGIVLLFLKTFHMVLTFYYSLGSSVQAQSIPHSFPSEV